MNDMPTIWDLAEAGMPLTAEHWYTAADYALARGDEVEYVEMMTDPDQPWFSRCDIRITWKNGEVKHFASLVYKFWWTHSCMRYPLKS